MSIKDVIPEGIASLVPDNLSDRTALSDLGSILVRDATKVDPTFDITGARTETETRPELLAAVPSFQVLNLTQHKEVILKIYMLFILVECLQEMWPWVIRRRYQVLWTL